MADHVRQQIRDRVTTLLTGLTTTGPRVYPSRVYPLGDDALPGLLIYTGPENSDIVTVSAPRCSDRELVLTVEGRAKAVAGLDATLDTICTEVEKALAADPTLNGLAHEHRLQRTVPELNGNGEQPVGTVTLEFAVMYSVAETTPDIPY